MRKSKYQYSDDALIDAIKSSKTLVDVRKKLNLNKSYSYKFLMEDITRLKLDISHMRKGKHKHYKTDDLAVIFCKNFIYLNNGHLKKCLFSEVLKTNQCEKCGITDWNNKPINLNLHHANEDFRDNRIENLMRH